MQSNKQADPRQETQTGSQDSRQQSQQNQQRDTQSPSRDRQQMADQDANGKGKVQGEGDYESNRRYTESAKDFVESGKVDEAARNAKPKSQQEAAEMRKAEQEGASHAKGGQSPSDGKKSQQG